MTRTLTMSISASKRCPYSRSWARWKASVVRVDPALVDLAGGRLEAHLVALAGVAAVREAGHDRALAAEAVVGQLPGRLCLELA